LQKVIEDICSLNTLENEDLLAVTTNGLKQMVQETLSNRTKEIRNKLRIESFWRKLLSLLPDSLHHLRYLQYKCFHLNLSCYIPFIWRRHF